MVHASIWSSEQVGKLSPQARLLYIATITLGDDAGRIKASAGYLRAQAFPYDDTTIADVEKWLSEIENARLLVRYDVDGTAYAYHPKWGDYQTIRADRRKSSNIPAPAGQPNDNQPATKRPARGGVSKDKRSKAKRNKDTRQSRVASQETQEKKQEEQPDPEGALINDAIDAFSPVNPSHDRLFRQTPQREAMRRLIRKHGLEKMLRTIKVLPEVNGQPFAPTITTPMQLEAKLGALIAWYQKHQAEGAGKGKEIID